MPLYEYECLQCQRHTEKRQKFSDVEITVCPHCGGKLQRVITAPAIAFKGGGWYADGYGNAKPKSSGDGAPAQEGKSAGEGKSANEGKSEPSSKDGSPDSGAKSTKADSSGTATPAPASAPSPSAPAKPSASPPTKN